MNPSLGLNVSRIDGTGSVPSSCADVEVARDEHLDRVQASTMTDNHGMCAVFRRLGFALSIDGDDVRAELDIRQS